MGGEGDKVEEWEEEEELPKSEASEYRGIAARMNFMSQDFLDLQFPIKPCSRDMATNTRG